MKNMTIIYKMIEERLFFYQVSELELLDVENFKDPKIKI